MTQVIKQLVRTNNLSSEVWITDKTGKYALSLNEGGWGTPNPELNQTALVAYVTHITPEGTVVLLPLSYAVSFSGADTNDTVRSIGFKYDGDGHYSSVLMSVPASSNGTTTLAGATITLNQYFYLTTTGVINQKTSGGNVAVTNYALLVADETIAKTQCDKMFYNKLAIKMNDEYYRDYQAARDGNDPDLAADLLRKINDLKADIAGADYRFRVALFTVAENIVAELLEKHAII